MRGISKNQIDLLLQELLSQCKLVPDYNFRAHFLRIVHKNYEKMNHGVVEADTWYADGIEMLYKLEHQVKLGEKLSSIGHVENVRTDVVEIDADDVILEKEEQL